jgi:hypothetical protein
MTAVRLIKKTGQSRTKKPWNEVSDSFPSVEAAGALMEGFSETSDSGRMTKWELKEHEVARWLGCSPYIHRVKFDGKVWLGNPKQVYEWPGFGTCQISFEKNTGHLRVKFRTFIAGYGRLDAGETTPPSLN